MPQHIACRITSQHGVALDPAEEFARVIVKNELQQIGERAPLRHLWAEKCRSSFAPCELYRSRFAGEPTSFAQNRDNITRRIRIRRGGCCRISSFLRRHRRILSQLGKTAGKQRHDYRRESVATT